MLRSSPLLGLLVVAAGCSVLVRDGLDESLPGIDAAVLDVPVISDVVEPRRIPNALRVLSNVTAYAVLTAAAVCVVVSKNDP